VTPYSVVLSEDTVLPDLQNHLKFSMQPVMKRCATELLETGHTACLPYLRGVDTQAPENIKYFRYYM